MAKAQKTLMIFSLDKNISAFLYNTVSQVIGHEVEIYSLSVGETSSWRFRPDLVMLSNEGVRSEASKLFPNCRMLVPRRIITCSNLEKLLRFPKGKKVLLVNHPRCATEETIDSLLDFGIEHLVYIPYWQGARISLNGIDTAISPGMAHLCPNGMKNIVDIGPRTISMHSFLQLLKALELSPTYLEKFANSYHNLLINTNRKLTTALDQSEMWRKHNEIILDEFDDGILSLDEKGGVFSANKSAMKLLGLAKIELLDENINKLKNKFQKVADLVEDSKDTDSTAGIYEYKDRKLLINKIPVVCGKRKSHIYILKEIDRIQKIEENVRKQLAKKGYLTKYGFSDIWSKSAKIIDIIDKARNFANTGMNILITGESGTGKELFAHAIHRNSPRKKGPFVAVNFAGLPESLMESELFGYEEGAFTGARKGGKRGLFEQAHGGTIFLDEIGDASLSVQSRLLRVLQEKEVMRVGGSKIVPVDVRVIAATNANLNEAINKKKFRNDLYYRLATLTLEIPPLRERNHDSLYIMNHYLKKSYGIRIAMSKAVVACILAYEWPGNVRELINTAEYMLYSSKGNSQVELPHLPDILRLNYERSRKLQKTTPENQLFHLTSHLSVDHRTHEEFYQILKILQDRKKQVNGRNSLLAALQQSGLSLTEGRMKKHLRMLDTHGLVNIGTTKQGTTISTKGEDFLEISRL